MIMNSTKNQFVSKPVYFSYIGFLVLAFSLTFFFNEFENIQDFNNNSLLYVLLSLIASSLFFFLGSKKRIISFDDTGISYTSSNMPFIAKWDEIMLIKSFQELGKSPENLIIIKNNEELQTISSSFFNIDTLMTAFREICKESSKYPNITIEDDLKWNDSK